MVNLDKARAVIQAAERRAQEIGQPMNIAVVDAGGNLVSHVRMDGAWLGSIEISINKAFTARAFDMPTQDLAGESQSGGSLFGINTTNDGRIVIFAGGIPLQDGDQVVGAVGVSGGPSTRTRRSPRRAWPLTDRSSRRTAQRNSCAAGRDSPPESSPRACPPRRPGPLRSRLAARACALKQRRRVPQPRRQFHPSSGSAGASPSSTPAARRPTERRILDERWLPALARFLHVRFTGLRREPDAYLDYYNTIASTTVG